MSTSTPTTDETPAIRESRTRNLLWRISRTLLVGYLAVCLLMFALERHLVYHPPPPLPNYQQAVQLGGEEVWLQAEDGAKLHGWFFPHEQSRLAVLYGHGNGEDAERNARLMARLRDELRASVFVFDYRGYGLSEGTPHESGVIMDGLAAQHWLADRMKISADEVVLYGRSLGGAVMVALAERLGAKALIVHGSFANMTDVAADRYFWLPVRLLMRNRYESAERIKNYAGPLLQIHGTADRVVPLKLARPLIAASPSKQKQFIEVPGGTHNDRLSADVLDSIVRFLEELTQDSPED
jgi:fermentation-respiration switch protein FrsA (DUF1100 family)